MDGTLMRRRMDALRVLMEDWANWQRGYTMKLGYPSQSAVVGGASCGVSSFEDLCESVDSETMRAVDAVVGDLPPMERSAIFRRYGIAAVFRYPRNNYQDTLDAAHTLLMVELPRRGVMIVTY